MTHIDDDNIGGTSRDLRTLGLTDPAEARIPHRDRETRIQRFGRTCLITGATIIVAAFIGALSIAIATDGPTFHNSVSILFATLALFAAISLATILMAVGSAERIQRPQRATSRQVITDIARLRAEVVENRETAQAVIAMVATLPGRLTVIEETIKGVPDYGRGVIDGMQVRNDALGPERR